MTLCSLLYALCLLVPKPNPIFYFDFFVFLRGYIETNQMGVQFLSPLSPPPEWGRVRVGVNLISETNSIFYFHFFIFFYGHFKSNEVSAQPLVGMGVRKHLPIAGDRFLH